MIRLLFRAASAFGALAVTVLVAVTAASVVARYVLGQPIAWTEEISGLLMVWIVMIGAIACEANRQHLTVDLAEAAMSPPVRRAVQIVVAIASAILLAVMAWEAWKLGQTAGFKRTQILGISWFWIDLAVVFGALGTAAVTLIAIRRPMQTESDLERAEHTQY
jgi:TRAP-type transport system small permease protein